MNMNYIMLHSFTQPGLFRWVDLAVHQTVEKTEVLHVAFYAPKGERACQFGTRTRQDGSEFQVQRLDPKVNAVYTAFVTPAGVAFQRRDSKLPWKYQGQLLPWHSGPEGSELAGPKLQALINACAGAWRPGQQDPFKKISVPMGAEIAQALGKLSLNYKASGMERQAAIAKFAAMAVKVAAEGIQLGNRLDFNPPKKQAIRAHESGLSLLEQALADADSSTVEELEVEQKEKELPRSSFTADGGSGGTAVAEAPEMEEDHKPKKRINNPFQD